MRTLFLNFSMALVTSSAMLGNSFGGLALITRTRPAISLMTLSPLGKSVVILAASALATYFGFLAIRCNSDLFDIYVYSLVFSPM
jgi:hypothetical protein